MSLIPLTFIVYVRRWLLHSTIALRNVLHGSMFIYHAVSLNWRERTRDIVCCVLIYFQRYDLSDQTHNQRNNSSRTMNHQRWTQMKKKISSLFRSHRWRCLHQTIIINKWMITCCSFAHPFRSHRNRLHRCKKILQKHGIS